MHMQLIGFWFNQWSFTYCTVHFHLFLNWISWLISFCCNSPAHPVLGDLGNLSPCLSASFHLFFAGLSPWCVFMNCTRQCLVNASLFLVKHWSLTHYTYPFLEWARPVPVTHGHLWIAQIRLGSIRNASIPFWLSVTFAYYDQD